MKRKKIREFNVDNSKESTTEAMGLSTEDLEKMTEYLNYIANKVYRNEMSTKELAKVLGETLSVEELVANAIALMKLQILMMEKGLAASIDVHNITPHIVKRKEEDDDDDDEDDELDDKISKHL